MPTYNTLCNTILINILYMELKRYFFCERVIGSDVPGQYIRPAILVDVTDLYRLPPAAQVGQGLMEIAFFKPATVPA